MPQEEREPTRLFEFEPRLLALFLFISIPFILIGSLLILGSVRNEINRRSGVGLADVAADTARHLDAYFLHNKTAVSMLAVTPTLIEGVAAANRGYSQDADAISEHLIELDREWLEASGRLLLAEHVVDNGMSEYLREVTAFNPAYREILVTDRYGALVAATDVTTDYYQADERWWQRSYGDGETGSIFLSTVVYDESVGAHVVEVAAPLRERLDDDMTVVSGVLKALINAGDLINVVGAVRVGESGHAFIVDASNQTVIAGDTPQTQAGQEYPGFNKLREAHSDEQRFFVAQHPGDEIWLAGFAEMTSPIESADLEWYVIVEQQLEEAQAPARAATMYLLTFFGLMVLIVLFFSLYMHFRLVRPIRQVDLREEMDRLANATSSSG